MRPTNEPAGIAILVAVLMFLVGGHASSYAESPPGSKPVVARGAHLAQLLCSACHVVAVDQEFPPILRQRTPSFSEIANRPETTSKSLQQFVSTTHWDEKTIPMQMPNPKLSKEEMNAVTSYILSLRKP